ncbi:IS3 family transposase [Deinococcus malanensis]|uniref:IS3 family transposase n=1 Tax=Deinococcus malanensis TaxID=1706855 RepID=UPI00362BD9BE
MAELTRLHGVAASTIHRWKAKYGDDERRNQTVSCPGRGKSSSEEAGGRPFAGQPGPQGGGRKTVVTPDATPQSQTPMKREMVGFVRQRFAVSERRACRQLGFWRSTQRHHSPGEEKDEALKTRLRELAGERPRFGYRRLHVLLGREGHRVNHNRVYRIYRAEGLAVRRKIRKKLTAGERLHKPLVCAANQRWSMDFMSDHLASGQRFRVLNVVDDFTRECLLMHVGTSITGADVARLLSGVLAERAQPAMILTDNGPEFVGKALDQWAHERGIFHHFNRPGKPIENAYIESFNGRVRDECLNLHWFQTLSQARLIVAAWHQDYNQVRPHSSLDNHAPQTFARLERAG